jgi:Rha family phage regulatory protein
MNKFMDLVKVENERVVVSSLDIAKNFGKSHHKILRDIRNLGCSEDFASSNFGLSSYEVNNRKYPFYLITRDGFSFLVMGFTGSEAAKWKEKYIKAFNKMEKALTSKRRTQDWDLVRLQSKEVRTITTDTIAQFVEYAKAQGSSNANFYYTNITKMEYKALGLDYKKDNNFRDSLSTIELTFLTVAENLVISTLQSGMLNNLSYKDIFKEAKSLVTEYSNVISKSRNIKLLT